MPFGRAGVLGKPVFRLTASSQLALGMIGLFIVHPRDPKSQVDHDFAILLSEWKIDVGARRPDPNEMTDFNVLTMNARVFPGTAPLVVKKQPRANPHRQFGRDGSPSDSLART